MVLRHWASKTLPAKYKEVSMCHIGKIHPQIAISLSSTMIVTKGVLLLSSVQLPEKISRIYTSVMHHFQPKNTAIDVVNLHLLKKRLFLFYRMWKYSLMPNESREQMLDSRLSLGPQMHNYDKKKESACLGFKIPSPSVKESVSKL